MKVQAVIMSHNTPRTTKALYESLSTEMNTVVIDSGSDRTRIANCPVQRRHNLYWTGCFKEAMSIAKESDVDMLWVLGGDVTLRARPDDVIQALSSSVPFQCWSPAIQGWCRPIGYYPNVNGRVLSVWHVEGIAMAVSKDLMQRIGYTIPDGNVLGWGVDIWLSWKGWESGRNIIDGRVSVSHPAGSGYPKDVAEEEMDRWLVNEAGPGYRSRLKMSKYSGCDIPFQENIREVLLGDLNV